MVDLDSAIGGRTYSQENYISDDETISQSLNVLDIAVDSLDSAIGTRTYTQDNYVTDTEALTFSIDALDQALFNISADTIPVGTLEGQTLRYTGSGW